MSGDRGERGMEFGQVQRDCRIAGLVEEKKGVGDGEKVKLDEKLTPSGMNLPEITQPPCGTIRLKCAAPAGG